MSDDVPNPLYLWAFVGGAFAMSIHVWAFFAVAIGWGLYGMYKQQTGGDE